MPKITEAHRQMRREQILDAAWRCFYRQGVQATTMDDIIREAGLSASAMYRYFAGKDDIICAAINASLGGLSKLLDPLLEDDGIGTPAELLARIMRVIDAFSARQGFHLAPIAIHGWSEAQRNQGVRTLIQGFYMTFRDKLGERVRRWQRAGTLPATVRAKDVAQTLHAMILGHVVQVAIMDDANPKAVARGLAGFHAGKETPRQSRSPLR